MTIQEFITKNQITATATQTDRNSSMPDFNADHWKVILYRVEDNPDSSGALRPKVSSMALIFSKGYAHKGAPPTAAEVLECLRGDACIIENCRGFKDFCGELGYDPDSRKAFKTYQACQRQTEKLETFLGELFNDFMNCEEE